MNIISKKPLNIMSNWEKKIERIQEFLKDIRDNPPMCGIINDALKPRPLGRGDVTALNNPNP